MDKLLILTSVIIVVGFAIPFAYLFFLAKKYGNKIPSFWMGAPVIILYLVVFFNYAGELIPESWKLIPYQVEECKIVTKYKEPTQ